ncbi:hypothetical protein HUB98_19320 [Paenibacillus barcinonensis]|uniref:Uncharacterized protein n=1 Tax=Paenibacillus barcinonensis TaxID=198119 RepID=A0A2V4W813_PAEBA|nr:DUF6001 family protein [Paenibacillus barcinonensis]PYE47275.1 hypothetical protein DFQ00_11415 [Paenibacillus barcinonensis]QKS58183.1 hypothetical protein HUB98_19320 [Paenibacillus barcinonensis]
MKSKINEIIAERIAYADQFLKQRSIKYDNIEKAFGCDVHDSKYLLLTSSAVHGLANSGSDIDFISVNLKNFPSDRVAAQHFSNGNHMEVKPIWEEDINEALVFLKSVENKPFFNVVEILSHWNDHCKVSKKHLERTINGVDINGQCPYMVYTPSLAYVWLTNSFEIFRKCVVYFILSERSGENIATVSYGLNSLLYLMDSVLSFHGYVYSNKKWYLQRYTNFVRENKYSLEFQELTTKINTMYNFVLSILERKSELSSQLYELYLYSRNLMKIEISDENLITSESKLHSLPFLEESIVVYNDNKQKAMLLNSSDIVDWKIPLSSLSTLKESTARQILSLLRTGLLKIN